MQNLYQIPPRSCAKTERVAFWNKVLADQSNSGMNMQKFCKLHQIQYSTFKRHKYNLYNTSNSSYKTTRGNSLKNVKNENKATKFTSLQIASDIASNIYSKDKADDNKITEVKIICNNGYKIILPLITSEANLLWLIKIVAELQC